MLPWMLPSCYLEEPQLFTLTLIESEYGCTSRHNSVKKAMRSGREYPRPYRSCLVSWNRNQTAVQASIVLASFIFPTLADTYGLVRVASWQKNPVWGGSFCLTRSQAMPRAITTTTLVANVPGINHQTVSLACVPPTECQVQNTPICFHILGTPKHGSQVNWMRRYAWSEEW